METKNLYNWIIDILLLFLLFTGIIVTFALEPKEEYFVVFLVFKGFAFAIMMLAYYGLHKRGVIDKLSRI